jgi:hypothetical protein
MSPLQPQHPQKLTTHPSRNENPLHQRALRAAQSFRSAEAELIAVISEIDRTKLFRERGHASLFQYITVELGLSESTTYAFITVARKANEVPLLAKKIQEGALSISQARKILPVLTPKDADTWLLKASQLSQRKLEKEVASYRPEAATRERARYVSASRVHLEVGLSESEMLQLRRAQDLLSQKRRRSVSLEETLSCITQEYLNRHDPVARAKRHQVRKGPTPALGSKPMEQNSEFPKPKNTLGPTETPRVTEKPHAETCAQSPHRNKLESIRVQSATPREVSPPTTAVPFSAPPKCKTSAKSRSPIPTSVKHQVHLRDQGRCTHKTQEGPRCNQKRWIEIHHIQPVSQGGAHTLENLTTLCSSHHRLVHAQSSHPFKSTAL